MMMVLRYCSKEQGEAAKAQRGGQDEFTDNH